MMGSRRAHIRVDSASKWWRPQPIPDTVIACASLHRGPHNRCRHPTPDPRGNRRCAADPGCPVMLPVTYPSSICPWHDDEASWESNDRVRQLIGGLA